MSVKTVMVCLVCIGGCGANTMRFSGPTLSRAILRALARDFAVRSRLLATS